jgi:hypothetical protein
VRYTKASQKEQRQHGKQQEQMGNECHATPDFKATPPNSTANIKKNSIGASPEAKGTPSTRRSGSAEKKTRAIYPAPRPTPRAHRAREAGATRRARAGAEHEEQRQH